MVLKIFPYTEKEGKEKARALDALSVLETMSELEEYNGTSTRKIEDNWFALKNQFREAMIVELKVEEPQKKEVKKE